MKVEIPIKIIHIENDGYHLLIKVLVNNRTASMLIDTGASKTVFDKSRITNFVHETEFSVNERLSTGLGTNTMESHLITIKKLKLGEIVLKNYESILLDLGHVNESYLKLGLKPIDGVLGSDLLREYKAVINYNKKNLKLNSKKKAKLTY